MIETIAPLYHDWRAEAELSAVISREEAARNDYNLSPSRYVSTNGGEEVLPLEEVEEERTEAEQALRGVLAVLGFGGREVPS